MFRNWVFKNFPFLEDDFDALTDYELFCKMVEYAKSLAISNDKFVSELESNLERMYNEGKFDSFIEEIINLQTTFTFDSVADMKSATNLIDGSYAKTSGFYTYNDGGGAYYKIRNIITTDIIDNMTLFAIDNDSSLVAELLIPDVVNVHQLGIFGDNVTDVTEKLEKAFNYNLYMPEGTYIISDKITINNHLIYGDGIDKTILKLKDNSVLSSDGVLKNQNIQDFTIKNLSFNGNSENVPEYKTFLILYSSDNILVENIKVYNANTGGIKLNDSTNVTIRNSYFENLNGIEGSTSPAIFGNPVNNLTIENCYCNNISDHFLYLTCDNDNKISKNIIVKNCILKGTGKDNLTNGSSVCVYANTQNVIIDNCFFENNRSAIFIGKYGTFTTTPKKVNISNCFINTTTLNSIAIEGLENNKVSDINISNCNVNYSNQTGISFLYGKNINISNCIINNNTTGITTEYTDIFNIYDSSVYDNSIGILIGSRARETNNVHIYNTLIYGVEGQTTGLYLNSGDNMKIYQCDIFNNTNNINQNLATNVSYINMVDKTSTNTNLPSITFSNRIPQSGTYKLGDIIFFNSDTSTYSGAVCTVSGTPGTWRTF